MSGLILTGYICPNKYFQIDHMRINSHSPWLIWFISHTKNIQKVPRNLCSQWIRDKNERRIAYVQHSIYKIISTRVVSGGGGGGGGGGGKPLEALWTVDLYHCNVKMYIWYSVLTSIQCTVYYAPFLVLLERFTILRLPLVWDLFTQ